VLNAELAERSCVRRCVFIQHSEFNIQHFRIHANDSYHPTGVFLPYPIRMKNLGTRFRTQAGEMNLRGRHPGSGELIAIRPRKIELQAIAAP